MKNRNASSGPPAREIAVATVLLLLYALALFGNPDPEWAVWAGQMTVGVLYVPPPASAPVLEAREALHAAAATGAAGLLAAGALGLGNALRSPRGRDAWQRFRDRVAPGRPAGGRA